MAAFDLVEETVPLGGRRLVLSRPRSPEALIDEEAFARDEFLPYWAELWPSGLALARHVTRRRLRGRRVLELGCGLALPSLAASLAGARAVATDWSEDALRLARLNAARNGARLETRHLRWDAPAAARQLGRFELVLAADVLYEERNVAHFLALLPLVMAAGGEALVADPGRAHAAAFLELAAGRWSVETHPVEGLPRGGVHRLWDDRHARDPVS